jgi:hypothetical protein
MITMVGDHLPGRSQVTPPFTSLSHFLLSLIYITFRFCVNVLLLPHAHPIIHTIFITAVRRRSYEDLIDTGGDTGSLVITERFRPDLWEHCSSSTFDVGKKKTRG